MRARGEIAVRLGAVALSAVAIVITGAILPARAQTPAQISVERLLGDGWEIAGYGALPFEGRTFILFKHKDQKYLVQCSVLYDVTRNKRVQTNCYEVR